MPVVRTAFVIAVLLLATSASGAAPSAVVSKPVPLPPETVPVDRALAAAAATDSVWVHHNTAPRAVLVPPDLASRLRDVLLRPERVNPGVDPPEICVSCPDQLLVYIGLPTLASFSPRLEVMVFFREAQVRYKTLDGWVGWSSIRADGAGLLDLVKQALPADSVVQSYVWSPRPDSLSPGEPPLLIPESSSPYPWPGHVTLPEPILKRPPAYPDSARNAHVQGTVVVEAVVDEGGRVVETRILKSIPLLDGAAEAAVRQWLFKPAMKDGRPVTGRVAIPVKFTLH